MPKKPLLSTILYWALVALVFVSCKDKDKNNGTPAPSSPTSQTVKYELTGTYSGTVMVGYTNESGAHQLADKVSIPWSKEITITGNNIPSIVLSASSEVGGQGLSGETLTGKIYVGEVVKKNATVNTTNTGYADLGVLSYMP